MKRFKSYITEISAGKGKNSHMTHIEDLILDGGVKGAREAITALSSIGKMMAGHQNKNLDISVKWDGAPAVFAGTDPSDGEFFVAKKGIFNKNPKVYKSHADIDADTSGDLNTKLKLAYDNLKNLGITNVIQGDFMYSNDDLKKETIDGVPSVTFHPNTIAYAVPLSTKLATQILNSRIGIVWHTSYQGGTFETMTPTYGASITKGLKSSKNVWMVDATMDDLSGTATLTASETKALTDSLKKAGQTFRKVQSTTLKEIEQVPELNLIINTFNNTKVRAGQRITDPKKHVQELIEWVNTRYMKQSEKLKSAKGKAKVETKRQQFMAAFFSKGNQKNLEKVFELQGHVTDAKLIIINKLNELNTIGTFTKTSNGYVATNPEGFVAIDRSSGGAVKLVDRLEFSMNNFNPAIIKGWQNPG
tara:strand:+ start:1211 stop:2464 length:1254 start_codon:yes stop_codon:yes gene_type:complete